MVKTSGLHRPNILIRNRLFALFLFFFFINLTHARFSWGKSPGQDLLDEGVTLYKQERYPEALLRFKQATKRDPGLLKGWENIGWTYSKMNRKEEAIRVWETLLKLEPDTLSLLNEIGNLHLTEQAWDHAARYYLKSLRVRPDQPNIRLRLGEVYEAEEKWDAAARQYEAALGMEPENLVAILRKMALYEKREEEEKAIAFLEKAVSHSPSPLLPIHLGRLNARRGNQSYQNGAYLDAETAYRTALRWDPENPQYWISLGWTDRKQGKIKEAIRHWQQALTHDPNPSRLYRPLAEAYMEQGETAIARGWYERGWQSGRRDPEIPYRLGEIALQEGKLPIATGWLTDLSSLPAWEDEAWPLRTTHLFIENDKIEEGIAFLQGFIKSATKGLPAGVKTAPPSPVGPALGRLYAYRGGIAVQGERYETAIQDFTEALRFDPKNRQAHRDLGWSYWRIGKLDLAEGAWKRYREIDSDRPDPHNLLTQLYLFKGRNPEAIASARASLELLPNQPDERLRLAKAYFLDRRFDAARSTAEQLAGDAPDHLPIQTFWGEMLMQHHDFHRGKTQWRKVLDLGSNSPKAEYFWLRSMYESGEYEKAVAEAMRRAEGNPPKQAILRFLAEDALLREKPEEAIRWYRRLTGAFPEHPSFWLELSRLYQEIDLRPERLETLRLARQAHPDHLEILLSLAEALRLTGNYDESERLYTDLEGRYPDNRRVYTGLLQTRVEAGRLDEALVSLSRNRAAFLKEYEVDLQKGAIYTGMGNPAAAESAFARVARLPETKRHIPILLYHGLSDHSRSMNLSADLLDSQLKALREAGYRTITVRELGRMIDGKEPFPSKPILITFDDARIDSFVLGDPILAKHGMKATMFVPTARILDKHPFFADWETIRRFAATGRWDLQSHGDHAHDLIPTDSSEQLGSFLVNRLWIKEQARLEQEGEFLQRLEFDYRESLRLLGREVPGLDLIGYAFPFSEAGQENVGNEPRAAEINERFLGSYFRFGFVQDQNGYNVVETGPSPPGRMLRRFNVPRSWDGKKLLDHLTLQHPGYAATLKIGQSHYWNGRYQSARTLFQRLPSEAPLLKGESEYYLAALSYQEGRFREAREHFNRSLEEGSERAGGDGPLMDKIRWQNRPQVGGRLGLFHDSNDRTNHWESISLRYPLDRPIDLWTEVGQISFREKGFSPLSGQEWTIGARWHGLPRILLEGKVRARFLERDHKTVNAWIQATHLADLQEIELQGGYEDVETLRAHEAGLQTKNLGARYLRRITPQWVGRIQLLYRSYDDGNDRIDFRSGLSYRIPAMPDWQVGALLIRSDTQFQSDRYYTPAGLNVARTFFLYRRSWNSGSLLEGEGGFGLANDRLRGNRWVEYGAIRSVYAWNDRLRASFNGEFNRSPGYHSWTLEASVSYLF